jgi:branched-chain amino acid transport system ATP-binding protein
LVPIFNGEIEFFDQRIDKIKAHRIVALGIALVPEGRRVFGRMSVLENLQLGTTVLKDRDQKQEILGFLFQLFPVLKERLKQQAGTLSGGEQQMLAIGRALMSKPKLLMADEVTMGLAPLVAANICKNLKEITERQAVSIILVEQNAKIALEVAERSYLLEGGEIVLSGKARDMAGDTDVRKVYLGID